MIVVAGPESSGTRLLAAIVGEMGVEAHHRSFPNGGEWPDLSGFDRAVLIVRNWFETLASQEANGHWAAWPDVDPEDRNREALRRMLDFDGDWILVTYEAIVLAPQRTADRIAGWLGVEPANISGMVYDGNNRWA